MNRYSRWALCAVAAAILVLPTGVSVQSGQDGRSSPAKDWTSFGGDLKLVILAVSYAGSPNIAPIAR